MPCLLARAEGDSGEECHRGRVSSDDQLKVGSLRSRLEYLRSRTRPVPASDAESRVAPSGTRPSQSPLSHRVRSDIRQMCSQIPTNSRQIRVPMVAGERSRTSGGMRPTKKTTTSSPPPCRHTGGGEGFEIALPEAASGGQPDGEPDGGRRRRCGPPPDLDGQSAGARKAPEGACDERGKTGSRPVLLEAEDGGAPPPPGRGGPGPALPGTGRRGWLSFA